MNCDFKVKSCQWTGLEDWSWVSPSYNELKKDSPIYDPNGKFFSTTFW